MNVGALRDRPSKIAHDKHNWREQKYLPLRLKLQAITLLAVSLCCQKAICSENINLMGVNIAGAEFNQGGNKRLNFDYVYPSPAEIDYFASKGFGVIRLPFDLSRLYPAAFSALSPAELNQISKTVAYANLKSLRVVLDPHNFGMIRDSRTGQMLVIGHDAQGTKLFVDFWSRLATAFKGQPNVVFGLMNEPYKQTPTEWRDAAVLAVVAIRSSGARQLILIPGTSFTGAHSWTAPGGNGVAWAGFRGDPLDNFAYEMHQYLDVDNSGTHPQCSLHAGSQRLIEATKWLKNNHARGFLGEFAWSSDSSCRAEKSAMMRQLSENKGVWIGWTWWAGGAWWPQSYPFGLDPVKRADGARGIVEDRPQLGDLQSLMKRQ